MIGPDDLAQVLGVIAHRERRRADQIADLVVAVFIFSTTTRK
jgi:hypothetical protein